jgi:hypothetical protein
MRVVECFSVTTALTLVPHFRIVFCDRKLSYPDELLLYSKKHLHRGALWAPRRLLRNFLLSHKL